MTDGLKPKYREVIIAKLSAHPRVERIVLFGSRAMGTFTTTSDIDIALFGGSLTLSDQAILAEAMAELSIPQRVDILVYHRIESQPLREHIHRHGVEWFARRQRKSVTSAMAGEWVTTTLGNICTFVSGSVFPQSEQGKTHGKYPFIKVSDMNLSGNERFITRANNWIGEKTQARLRANVHPKGTTVFAKIGVALTYNRRRILSQPTIIDNNMMAAIAESGRVHSLFFYYLLRTIDFNEIVVGTALPYLNIGDLKRIAVTLPSPKQQQAIACILGTLDDKIELNRRMNETLEGMARVLFKAWFVDFDPVRAKAAARRKHPGWTNEQVSRAACPNLKHEIAALFPDSFTDAELGEIPKGWSVTSLADQITASKGLSYKGQHLCAEGEGLPMHNLNSVYEGGGYKHEGLKWYNGEYRPAHLLKPGDVIVTNTEQGFDYLLIGYAAIVPERYGPQGLFSHHIFRIRQRSTSYLPAWFTYLLLRAQRFHDIVAGHSNGTTVNMLPLDGLQKPQFVLPPKALVERFEALFLPAQQRIERIHEENTSLAALRDTLMPKLISGELVIAEAERIAGRCA